MKITIPVRYLVAVIQKAATDFPEADQAKIKHIADDLSWNISRADVEKDSIEVQASDLSKSIVNYILQECTGKGRGHVKARRGLETWLGMVDNPESVKVQILDSIPSAAKSYMKTVPNHWIFKEHGKQGIRAPYIFSGAKYEPGRSGQNGYPASASISFANVIMGERKSFSISLYAADLGKGGKSISDIFKEKGISIATERRIKLYERQLKRFYKIRDHVGGQYLAEGFAAEIDSEYSWRHIERALRIEGERSKVVVDSLSEEATEIKTMKNFYYKEDEENDDVREYLEIPINPHVKIFSLEEHLSLTTHIDNLELYEYNGQLIDKLVIDPIHKDLIKILTKSTGNLLEDIVDGKAGGIFILGTGEPGLGKTLTAEIISEFIEAPLYKVQCSQLGIDVDTVEKNLKEVLQRSNRWGAILLIDEADVYIRKRSTDIQQNAIVGVFLRLIEYYKGILFMTSNLGDDIDDAIKSRATAQIDYNYPSEIEAVEIWKVLSEQFEIEFKESYKEISEEMGKLSGRDIKNILKLVKLVSIKTDDKINLELLKKYKTYIVK